MYSNIKSLHIVSRKAICILVEQIKAHNMGDIGSYSHPESLRTRTGIIPFQLPNASTFPEHLVVRNGYKSKIDGSSKAQM